jgi:putative long chain acyl-CoA synthase
VVQDAGRPRPGPDTWWYNRASEAYEVLTEDQARVLLGG